MNDNKPVGVVLAVAAVAAVVVIRVDVTVTAVGGVSRKIILLYTRTINARIEFKRKCNVGNSSNLPFYTNISFHTNTDISFVQVRDEGQA